MSDDIDRSVILRTVLAVLIAAEVVVWAIAANPPRYDCRASVQFPDGFPGRMVQGPPVCVRVG